jgi:hypothetical protein
MKALFLSVLSVFLTGCICTYPTHNSNVITEYQFIVRTADAQLKQEPTRPAVINTDTGDQIDLATWIAKNEGYIKDLRASRKRLIEYYERPITKEEQELAKAKSKLDAAQLEKPSEQK